VGRKVAAYMIAEHAQAGTLTSSTTECEARTSG
jgi:hypothetical protein